MARGHCTKKKNQIVEMLATRKTEKLKTSTMAVLWRHMNGSSVRVKAGLCECVRVCALGLSVIVTDRFFYYCCYCCCCCCSVLCSLLFFLFP